MRERWDTGRTEAFSDGVFAIAITLLVLDIRIPPTEFDHLWSALFHEWPAYLGFATSFITIGGIWLAHHGIFRRLRYANRAVMRLNLLLLMAVSFLPYPTRLVAEAIRSESAERAAVVFLRPGAARHRGALRRALGGGRGGSRAPRARGERRGGSRHPGC